MTPQLADAFAKIEKQGYQVVSVGMNQETYEWMLLWRPDFAEEIWGANVVITDYKDHRVHLEGRMDEIFRETTHFYAPQVYSETSSSGSST